jgi:hypothetical protein
MLNPGADPGPKDERQPGDFSAEEGPTETVTDVTARDVPSQRRGTADNVTRAESEVVDEYIEE